MTRVAFAAFLVFHGLIHASYLTPRPAATGGPAWPFELGNSWLLSPIGVGQEIVRAIGVGLTVAAVGGFVVAGLIALGAALPASWWQPLAAIAAIASLLLLGLYFHPWLVLGIGIDLVLLVAIWQADWSPDTLT